MSFSSLQRGQHNINDELIFENNDRFIFHDSRGFESGSEKELKTIQDFVRKKAGEKRLRDRLHAIWFVVTTSIWVILIAVQVLHSHG